eukprot:m.12256 g.12256  ORF g.12256 m.12256 type:complete len:143 (+) comp17373_c0_seq2:45-473(+)
MVAAINGSTNCARALVAYGADYSLRDLEGRTALEIARQCSRSATVAFLEEHERLISGMHIKAAEDDVAEEPEQEHLALTEADSEQLIEEVPFGKSLANYQWIAQMRLHSPTRWPSACLTSLNNTRLQRHLTTKANRCGIRYA